MPPKLGIVIVGENDSRADELQALIAKNFRTRISSISNPRLLNQKVYSIDPDIICFDEFPLQSVAEDGDYFQINDQSVLNDRFVIIFGDKPSRLELESDRYFELSKEPDKKTVLNAIDRAAQDMGYMTTTGNVDDRLVRRQLNVRLEVEDTNYSGKTTGLDLDGCGVRLETADERLQPGRSCRLALLDSDLKGFIPAACELRQVEESWEDGYEAYVKLDFTGEGFPGNDLAREVIKDLIDRQEDQSVSFRE
jgi:hypothetical protein